MCEFFYFILLYNFSASYKELLLVKSKNKNAPY